MPTLTRPRAEIRYEVWGEQGPWATLVNGHTRPLNDFRMLGRHLVESGFRVVALDNRGAGETTATEPFTLTDMASDVIALWDALGIAKTRLLGISMGGFIAQKIVELAPSRVEKLALVSTAPDSSMIGQNEAPWSTDPEANLAKLSAHFTPSFRERNLPLVKGMAKQIAKAVEDGDFQARSDAQRAAARGFDGAAALGRIRCPTIVVHGTEDRVIPLEAGERLAQGIPGARLARVEGAGHLLLAEKPKELYGLVSGFFGE